MVEMIQPKIEGFANPAVVSSEKWWWASFYTHWLHQSATTFKPLTEYCVALHCAAKTAPDCLHGHETPE